MGRESLIDIWSTAGWWKWNFCLFSDPDRISSHLTSAIVQAHESTILSPSQTIREKWRMGIDQNKLVYFKNMVSDYFNSLGLILFL